MIRKLLIAAAGILALGVATAPAEAQQGRWRPELERLHGLCNQGYRPACIRFGYILGEQRINEARWRREHPDWWWWQPWVR